MLLDSRQIPFKIKFQTQVILRGQRSDKEDYLKKDQHTVFLLEMSIPMSACGHRMT